MRSFRGQLLSLFIIVVLVSCYTKQEEDIPHNEVKNWALKFGVNLWLYGNHVTQMHEIKRRFREATVRKKDGVLLTRDIAAEVKNLMDMKRNAILRIMDSAEQAALSLLSEEKRNIRAGPCHQLREIGYRDQPGDEYEMAFRRNSHFDYQSVNTSFACFLFPSGVTDEDPKIRNEIRWVQELDAIFKNNYEIDPFLGWQYFATPRGALYQYPAVKWPTEGVSSTNIEEFRLSSWFVEAMTSSKDIVILMDTSSSLSDSSRQLTRVTAKTILDTLADNDFVNIFSLNTAEQFIVPCFRDLLVQATERNKRKLLQAVKTVQSGSDANVTGALTAAFEILHRYNRSSKGSQCNQAIMLIVDDKITSDYSDIIKQYNWPHKPVRIFTYLISNSKSKETEMKSIACNNKGYYEHIQWVDQIKEKVLNYLLVMARPLIMYENDHPIHWSSVYVDNKNFKLDLEGNLIISASTAAFDKRQQSERTANVLGVASADIPIQEIKKLISPHKIGVNGHSFLVNSNGHLVYHPELRTPLHKTDYAGNLKQSNLGVDLSDIEFADGIPETENNTYLLELRRDMIDQKEGELDIRLKVSYDSMRRVTFRSYKYFFHPIYDTPFTLGIALPDDYGMYEITAEEEVKRSSVNVTDFFQGRNWTVHPEWVYCEYHYPEYKDFHSPEEQVLHFLNRAIKPGWKWMSMRPRPLDQNLYLGEDLPTRNINSYFCDKNLLQSLIFDAKITQDFETSSSISTNKHDKHHGHDHFGVTLTFIATRSGLLRWRNYAASTDQMGQPHFSRANAKALDEIWYKRAVDYYEIDAESFVYSVPFNSGGNDMSNSQVTATHAIFVENQGYKTPVAVIGIQFQHRTLATHILNITAACMGGMGCKKTCTSDDLDCYVLDDNGFVIISEKADHTGQFFGEIDGTIMDSLVQDGIYKKVIVHDYQASCEDNQSPILDSAFRIKPFQTVLSIVSWLLTHLLWLLSELGSYQLYSANSAYGEPPEDENPSYSDSEDYDNNVDEQIDVVEEINNIDYLGEQKLLEMLKSRPSDLPTMGTSTPIKITDPVTPATSNAPVVTSTTEDFTDSEMPEEKDVPSPPPLYVPSPHKIRKQRTNQNNMKLKTCTKKAVLYILQAARLNNSGLSNPLKGKLTNCHATGCERPFSVQKIPHSNLMLLVVDTLCPCGSKQLNIQPKEVTDAEECNLKYDNMHRRRAFKCVNYHPEESEIQQCGLGYLINASYLSLLLPFVSYITS